MQRWPFILFGMYVFLLHFDLVAQYLGIQQQIEHSPTCPLCRQEISLDNISRNLIAERQSENLQVWCRYHFEFGENDECIVSEMGCNETLLAINLAAHEKQCTYAWTNCPYSDKCGKIRKKNRSEHERDCIYRTTECEYCFCLVQLPLLNEHQLQCKAGPTQCNYCGLEMTRANLATHEMEACLEYPIECPYKCTEKIKRKDLKQHNKDYSAEHIEFLREDIQQKHAMELKVFLFLVCPYFIHFLA